MKKRVSNLTIISEILDLKPLLFITSFSNKTVNASVYASYIPINNGKMIIIESSIYKYNKNERINSVFKHKEEIKDTLYNAKENGFIVLNIPFSKLLNQINILFRNITIMLIFIVLIILEKGENYKETLKD